MPFAFHRKETKSLLARLMMAIKFWRGSRIRASEFLLINCKRSSKSSIKSSRPIHVTMAGWELDSRLQRESLKRREEKFGQSPRAQEQEQRLRYCYQRRNSKQSGGQNVRRQISNVQTLQLI